MSSIVCDASVLVAADRSERRTRADHRARLEFGLLPLIPAPVVAQISRSPQQAQLRRFLAGLLSSFLLKRERGTLDGAVAEHRHHSIILTGDPDGIAQPVSASGREVGVAGV